VKQSLLILLVIASYCSVSAQEYGLLRGYVTDSIATPLPGVLIRLGDGGGTLTDNAGRYELRLPQGVHRISFQYISYKSAQVDQLINGNTTLNIVLKEDADLLKQITIANKRKDYSYMVIRNAVAEKKKYQTQFLNQKRTIYVKSKEQIIRSKKEEDEGKKKEDANTLDAVTKKQRDSLPNLHYFEGKFTQYIQTPRGLKQVKEAAKRISDQQTLMYTNTTDADFDFYANVIQVKKLGDNSYISPLSNTTFLSYKFKMLGSDFESGEKYYRIQVKPRKTGNALFSGEIHIWDRTWRLKYVNLSLPKRSLIVYNRFNVEQHYGYDQGKWILQTENLTWQMKTHSETTTGTANVLYTEYSFDSTYAKRFFNAEMGITQDSAYERDTSYWATIRPIPLTSEESTFIAYNDSLLRRLNSKQYLDSIDSVFNKVTLLNLLWDGQGYINREKKVVWQFNPAIAMINPVAIGGFRLKYNMSYNKTFESRKRLYVSPTLNYGFRNNDMKGGGSINFTYNPMRLSKVNLSYFNEFDVVNQFATFQDILSRKNFFETNTIRLGHTFELINGLYLGTSLSSNIRKPLADFEFNPALDSTFNNLNNPPLAFETNGSSVIRIGLTYTPKQLFIQEPKEKIVLGSRWPTVTLYYQQAVPTIFNSTTDFKYIELGMNQKINLGIFGTSEYNIQIGSFLDTTEMLPMDYRYQRGGDPYFFIPPMFGYQLIDSTFSVFRGFFESHYNHEFNGFLTSKLPGLKQLNIRLSAGGGLLYVPERNFRYAELHTGTSRLFRWGSVRFKLGAYYVVSQSNKQGFRSGFKFLVTPWNSENSSWAF
jgi:hypothetical protein